MIDSQIEYILNDIRTITENVVVKMTHEAQKYETVDSKREGDRYVSAMLERDIFESHAFYERDILMKAGINDVDMIEECYFDKYKIPRVKRPLVLQYKRDMIKEEFYETNDYYRELIGLPPMDDTDDVYLTQEQMDYYKIDEVRPIHEYPYEIQIKLERIVIPDLIEKHPDKKYLQHLGSKKVDLVRVREAKNFEIVFSDAAIDNVFLRSFFQTYDFCREYFMSVIYNKAFTDRYDLYENFIGMNIMIMAVQRMIVNTIKLSIDRDFYDLNSIKKMFDCYGVPFFEDLPLDYQRTIIKNLNMLIRSKSTDKVLYDISNILMYERIKIYKYMLVKERKLDENNNPIIAQKPVYDDDGNMSYVPDYEKMYDVYFQSADIMEPNIAVGIESKPNRHGYLDVTEDDVLWWDTSDLRQELFNREFNFIETKYLGVNIMYNLTDLLYETVYFLNLLVDNKDTTDPTRELLLNSDAMRTGTDYLYLVLERFSPVPISIFDTVVILCALVSKKNGMKGNIIHSSAGKILSVFGFNFEADFDLIRESIKNNPRIFKDPSIVKYLDLLDIKKVEDIEKLYHNFRNFADFCIQQMATTENLKEYHAYKRLYEVFTVREETGEAFTMSNGKIADTYLEYLYDKLPHIAEFIDAMHKDKTGVYIEHVVGKLNELVPDLEYISAINGTNNNIVRALISLINFFKSYTTDLRNLNVVYIFNDKYHNMIRMIDDPRLFIKLFPREKPLEYNDFIHETSVNFASKEKIDIDFLNRLFNKIVPKDKVYYFDKAFISKEFEWIDNLRMVYSDLVILHSEFILDEKDFIDENQLIIEQTDMKDSMFIEDKNNKLNNLIDNIHKLKFDGKVDNVKNKLTEKDRSLKLRDTIKIIYED